MAEEKKETPEAEIKQDATAPEIKEVEAAPVADKEKPAAEPKAEQVETKPAAEPKAEQADTGEVKESDASAPAVEPKKGKVRGARHIPAGIAHIKATFNNTIVSITDMQGGVIAWSNAGKCGFKGSRKSTAFAATMVAQEAARQAGSKGMREVEIRVQGAGAGRESAIRAIQSAGMNISVIKDITPMPHNGCRPRKRRRV